jgi:hypothetical protein
MAAHSCRRHISIEVMTMNDTPEKNGFRARFECHTYVAGCPPQAFQARGFDPNPAPAPRRTEERIFLY